MTELRLMLQAMREHSSGGLDLRGNGNVVTSIALEFWRLHRCYRKLAESVVFNVFLDYMHVSAGSSKQIYCKSYTFSPKIPVL
jgi:hypothetical protein